MDRGRMKGKNDMGSTSKKRGNMDDVSMFGRPSKKRKFVLIGKGWGKNGDKEEKGLDVKRGTGPLDGTSITNDQDLISISSGETVNKDYTVGTCIAGEQDMQVTNRNQESGGGTGPLNGTGNNMEDGLLMNVKGYNEQNKKKTQLSITQFTTKEVKMGDTTSLVERGIAENVGTLYDTASNVRMIRELRGNCVIRDGYCQEHNLKARKVTTVRNVWTKNSKTGIFGYRRRKVSALCCSRHMGTLVDTMRTRDGAREDNGAFSGRD